MTAHEILVAGRNRLAAGYLVKGRMTDYCGGYCAQGAFIGGDGIRRGELAALRGTDAYKPWHAAQRALIAALPDDWTFVPGFNNAPETTKDDVLALFDRAIAATAPEPDTSFLTLPERETV